ncbi:ribosome biogenesis GTPase YlqF [Rhodopirellula sallentina]|uniref:Ribosome biogenesis GTPase A n=1 Tax=Rhodopirellula sallentina SM41 TaxID=1263870 RepID=M5TVU5_9BACT|nr:ribosome biogenesis GTPase YlqF [Rhodopirellula sallentina]EMI53290.1 GTP-binding protein, ribosome biogenesis, YlqF [Rhodopirellula sallentina SM41]
MSIQWFPGHMHKARLEMQAVLPKVDVVVEVLDARIPYSSENPMLAELRGDKPCLKVLAKSDLADEAMTVQWQEHFNAVAGVRARAVTTEEVPTIRKIKYAIAQMVPHKEGKSAKAMIMGIPNVGKSTIINVLAGRKIAKTGNTPAITKQQQSVNIGDGVTLLDTPGVLWPNLQNTYSSYRLALLGSIQETAMEYSDVAFFGARYLLDRYVDRLVDRFDLDSQPSRELELIEAIGRKRGCLGKNNQVDLERASKIFVTEIRSGGLGPLTFETPQGMEREKAETSKQEAEKVERDREKEAKRKKRFRAKQRAQKKSREMRG